MPTRSQILGAYFGVMLVVVIAIAYYSSASTAITTTTPITPWCRNGVYGNGQPILQKDSTVGRFHCGPYNMINTCTAQPTGDPQWVVKNTQCAMAWPYRNTGIFTIVSKNTGTLSGNAYCSGNNGELAADWSGAKCVSAGFNATGTPAGVSCDTVPGAKPGFRIVCQKPV